MLELDIFPLTLVKQPVIDLEATNLFILMDPDRKSELKRCTINLDSEYGKKVLESIKQRYHLY